MKKKITIIATLVVLVLSMVLLTACGAPSDPFEYLKKLETAKSFSVSMGKVETFVSDKISYVKTDEMQVYSVVEDKEIIVYTLINGKWTINKTPRTAEVDTQFNNINKEMLKEFQFKKEDFKKDGNVYTHKLLGYKLQVIKGELNVTMGPISAKFNLNPKKVVVPKEAKDADALAK